VDIYPREDGDWYRFRSTASLLQVRIYQRTGWLREKAYKLRSAVRTVIYNRSRSSPISASTRAPESSPLSDAELLTLVVAQVLLGIDGPVGVERPEALVTGAESA
jgi:hypothetical protein